MPKARKQRRKKEGIKLFNERKRKEQRKTETLRKEERKSGMCCTIRGESKPSPDGRGSRRGSRRKRVKNREREGGERTRGWREKERERDRETVRGEGVV